MTPEEVQAESFMLGYKRISVETTLSVNLKTNLKDVREVIIEVNEKIEDARARNSQKGVESFLVIKDHLVLLERKILAKIYENNPDVAEIIFKIDLSHIEPTYERIAKEVQAGVSLEDNLSTVRAIAKELGGYVELYKKVEGAENIRLLLSIKNRFHQLEYLILEMI